VRKTNRFFGAAVLAVTLTAAGLAFAAAPQNQTPIPPIIMPGKLATSGTPYELHLVPTQDEIYAPIGIRKPEGKGPFPAVLFGSGAGRRGVPLIETALYRLEPMMDEMIKRGYVVVYTNPRNEVARAYNTQNRPEVLPEGTSFTERSPRLDSDDYITFIKYVQALPYVSKVGTVGASHNGELQSKAAAEITWDAAVSIEGATHEFMPVDYSKSNRNGQNHIETVEMALAYTDKEKSMARIRKIKTPFLLMGRKVDELQGLFKLTHDWMKEAGVDATWYDADHPVHGYGLLYRKPDGTYQPDAVQLDAFNTWMAFFDKHLKSAN